MQTLDWRAVWSRTADDLGESWSNGLGRLITEDVLRFSTIKALVSQGVPARDIEAEWRREGVKDAVDLVLLGEHAVAIEFKYPREPRETNAAWTMHLGELLKDVYRLAYMPPVFRQRLSVQLITPRMQRYLAGVVDRHSIEIGLSLGQRTVLSAATSGLPPTATRLLGRWVNDGAPVVARCVFELPVHELTLLVHEVDPNGATPD